MKGKSEGNQRKEGGEREEGKEGEGKEVKGRTWEEVKATGLKVKLD